MKKDKNYWLERGKDFPTRYGFICVGGGDAKESLISQETKFRGKLRVYVDLDNAETLIYYIKEEEFNNTFPDKTKQEKLTELLAEAEKLKREIAEEENRFKVGDVLFAENESFGITYIFKVSGIQSDGYFAKKFFGINSCRNCQNGLFGFFSYKFTKIDL